MAPGLRHTRYCVAQPGTMGQGMHEHAKIVLFLCVCSGCLFLVYERGLFTQLKSVRLKYLPRTLSVLKDTYNKVFYGNTSTAGHQHNKGDGAPKIILLWTTFFGNKDYMFGLGRKPFFDKHCAQTNCMTTNDRRLLRNASAVVFHIRDLNGNDLPKVRQPHQYFVFFLLESPYHTGYNLHKLRSYFNLTMSYRLDSDIYAPYGKVVKMAANQTTQTLIRAQTERLVKGKTHPVAWFVSNCRTPGRRETYVRALQKHIPVDVYGGCGPHKCPYRGRQCYEMLQRKYFFYLSFENSLCQDYATEKLFEPLDRVVVPVVRGEVNYTAITPRKSVINAADFKSAKDLATFLKKLMKDKAEYLSYFKWKQHNIVRNDAFPLSFCDLCELLHEKDRGSKSYRNLQAYWADGKCHAPQKNIVS